MLVVAFAAAYAVGTGAGPVAPGMHGTQVTRDGGGGDGGTDSGGMEMGDMGEGGGH